MTTQMLTENERYMISTAVFRDGKVFSFCLSQVSNTWIIRGNDGWSNTDTDIIYPFNSYTGKYYNDLAQWIEDQCNAMRDTEYITTDGIMSRDPHGSEEIPY